MSDLWLWSAFNLYDSVDGPEQSSNLMLSYFSAVVFCGLCFYELQTLLRAVTAYSGLRISCLSWAVLLEESNFVLACTPASTHIRTRALPGLLPLCSQLLLPFLACAFIFPVPFMDVSLLLLLWGFGWACSKSVGHLDADTFLGWFCFPLPTIYLLSFPVLQCYNSAFTLLLKPEINKQKPKPKQNKSNKKEMQNCYKYGHCWRILQIVTWTLMFSLAYT